MFLESRRPVLSPTLLEQLAVVNPFSEKPLAIELVEAWWICTWPSFALYEEKRGAYKSRGLAIRKWWAKATVRDLDRARQLMENRFIERAAAQQETLLERREPSPESRRLALRVVGR